MGRKQLFHFISCLVSETVPGTKFYSRSVLHLLLAWWGHGWCAQCSLRCKAQRTRVETPMYISTSVDGSYSCVWQSAGSRAVTFEIAPFVFQRRYTLFLCLLHNTFCFFQVLVIGDFRAALRGRPTPLTASH